METSIAGGVLLRIHAFRVFYYHPREPASCGVTIVLIWAGAINQLRANRDSRTLVGSPRDHREKWMRSAHHCPDEDILVGDDGLVKAPNPSEMAKRKRRTWAESHLPPPLRSNPREGSSPQARAVTPNNYIVPPYGTVVTFVGFVSACRSPWPWRCSRLSASVSSRRPAVCAYRVSSAAW
jgi:hypothetical protein